MALGVLACVIAVVCIIGILTFHKETEYLQGQAEVTEYRVSSKVPGRILEYKVHEGQMVRKGDTLAILEAPEVEAKKAQAEAVERAARAQSAKAQHGAQKAQIEGAYEMWQKAIVGVEIAQKSFNRVSNLYADGVVSEQKYDEAKAQYDAALATEKAAKSQYDLALEGARSEDKQMAAAQVMQARGALAEVNSYIHETVLTAYADGEVSEIFPHVGELVGTGAPIMNIAQMDDLWVTFNMREDCLKDYPVDTEFDAYVPAIDSTIRLKVSYMKDLGDYVNDHYPEIGIELPDKIKFIDSQELENWYPDSTSKERERFAAEEFGAIFVKRIGCKLNSGKPHDGRAPDYDDWELNGDIILWNPVLEDAFEISSMGIRVNAESMIRQLEIDGKEDRKEMKFHQDIINNRLPLTVGGGIGQSRLCMYFLKKAHIGEVQVSVWPEEMYEVCAENNIFLL